MIKPSVDLVLPTKSLPPLGAQTLRNYAEASGDNNPIHLDEAAAKKAGLEGVIAHGMLSAAYLGNLAQDFAQSYSYRLFYFQTRFKAMTKLGDVLTLSGRVKSVSEHEVVLELQVRNQSSELTTSAVAKLRPQ